MALRGGGLRAALRGGGLRAALCGVSRLHAASHNGCLCAPSRGGHLGGVVFTQRRAAVVFVWRCVGAWWSSSYARGLLSRGRCLCVAVGVVVGAVVGLAPGEVSACPAATAHARDGAMLCGSGANQRRGERVARETDETSCICRRDGLVRGATGGSQSEKKQEKRTKKTYLSHWAEAQLVVGCILATVEAAAMWFVCAAGMDS
jgi:hypothetical protein